GSCSGSAQATTVVVEPRREKHRIMPRNCERHPSLICEEIRMQTNAKSPGIDRRQFLATTSGGLLATAMPGSANADGPAGMSSSSSGPSPTKAPQSAGGSLRKIPIGVFDPVYDHLSLDEMLER